MDDGSTEPEELRARIARLEARLASADRHRERAEETCNRLTRVLESMSDAFVALDSRWRYTYVNAHAGRLFDRDPASLIGKHIWTEFPEGVGRPFHRAYERAVAEQRELTIEDYYQPYGRWFENRIIPTDDGLAIFFRDVTERHEAERRLRVSESLYRALFEQSLAGMYMIQDGRYVCVSPAFAEMTGYTREELYALPSVLEVIQPDDRALVHERLRTRLAGGMPAASRFRYLRRDGSVAVVEAQSRVVELESGIALVGFQVDITQRVVAEEELRTSEARFRSMIEHASDAISILDAEGVVRYASPSTARIFGTDPARWIGTSGFDSVHPDDRERIVRLGGELLASPGHTVSAEFRVVLADGSSRHVHVIAQNLLDDPAVRGIVANTRDITEPIEVTERLRASEARYRAMFESAGVGVARMSPEGRWLEVNPRLCAITGYSAEELVGRSRSELSPPEEREHDVEHFRRLLLHGETAFEFDKRLVRKDGAVVWVHLTGAVVPAPDGTPDSVVLVIEDVTERRALESRLRELAFHDPLTGLANRSLFLDRVAHAFERARREGITAAVLFLDLDDFKRVNDSLGHAAGDELLLAAAARLRHTVRESDTAARLGGDEFGVLIEDAHSAADAADLADRLAHAFRTPFTVAGREIVTGASIGVAVAEHGETPEDVLRNADVAMYVAKARGQGSFEVFAPGMHAAVLARMELEADLRRALGDALGVPGRNGFRLVFQPIVDLATRRALGAEALLRWHEPTRGEVAPTTFIPVAEDTGLIVPLGRWVLREACRAAARWGKRLADRRPEAAGLTVTVNVSGRQLSDPRFVDDVRLALAESGLAPWRLVLELTESVLIHHAPEIAERMEALRTLGVRLAVDDFGTGYSSLVYLQRFPLDVLKVDRAFVHALGSGTPDAAIARAVVALGHALELQTVAEGVESARQAEQLLAMGCSAAQGFHFGAPAPADAIERMAQA